MEKSFLSLALSIKDIRKSEMILPIARKKAFVTPFLLGDHTALKTSLLSPQNYDREMIKCLHKHLTICDEDDVEIKLDYNELIKNVSNIDKIFLIWACYKSTYGDLGVRKVECLNPECKEISEYKITLDELLHEDSLLTWEEPQPFNEYIYPIEVPFEDYTYTFESLIPTIYKHNLVLGTIPLEKIKANLETNAIFSASEQLTVLIKSIVIKKNNTEIARTENLQEILATTNAALPSFVSEEFHRQYGEKFSKYNPKFYTYLKCPKCQQENILNIDIETEFFQRVLFGRGTV